MGIFDEITQTVYGSVADVSMNAQELAMHEQQYMSTHHQEDENAKDVRLMTKFQQGIYQTLQEASRLNVHQGKEQWEANQAFTRTAPELIPAGYDRQVALDSLAVNQSVGAMTPEYSRQDALPSGETQRALPDLSHIRQPESSDMELSVV